VDEASLVLDRRPQDVHVSLQALGEALQVLGAWWLLAQAQFQRTVANAAAMRRMLYHLEVKLKVSGRLGNIVHGYMVNLMYSSHWDSRAAVSDPARS